MAEKRGRKWFDGKDEAKVISEIKHIWGIGGTDTEAASYADISNASLSRYIDAHPELAEIRNRLQQKPFIYARETIVKAIQENAQAAFEYMKRKKKIEFGDNIDLTSGGEKMNNYTDEQIKAIASRINSNGGTPSEKKPD